MVARYYESVTVEKKRGEPASGLIIREKVNALVLASVPGAEVTIPLGKIKAAKYSNVSLMPEIYDNLLKPEEIADLVTYLKHSKLPESFDSAGEKSAK